MPPRLLWHARDPNPTSGFAGWRGMKVLSVAVVVGALTRFAGQVGQNPAASVGTDRQGRDPDLAAIEKLKQQDVVRDGCARCCGDGGSVDR